MKWNRQQVLLALLGVIGCIRVGEYVLISMIEEPLQQLVLTTQLGLEL